MIRHFSQKNWFLFFLLLNFSNFENSVDDWEMWVYKNVSEDGLENRAARDSVLQEKQKTNLKF